MDIANFIIGQLVGLAEPLLVLGFIIKCLGWKESIKHQKRIYIGASLFVFLVAQGNGRFPGSYVIIIAIDVGLLCIFSLLFLYIKFCNEDYDMYFGRSDKSYMSTNCYAGDIVYYKYINF